MRHQGNSRNVYILFLFIFSIGFTVGGCTKTPGSSQGVQAETNAGNTKPAQEKGTCGSCHEEQAKFRAYGGHSTVSCETCHGVVEGNHVKAGTKPLVRGNDQCIECHALVEGPEAEKMSEGEILEHHLRVVEKKHVIKVKREKVKGRCVYCHDPHLGQ